MLDNVRNHAMISCALMEEKLSSFDTRVEELTLNHSFPIFSGGLAFTSIVGYRELFHTDDTYSILYAGTTDGTLLKIMNNLNEWAPPKVQELVVHKEPIRALKISMKRRMLFVAFDSGQYLILVGPVFANR